MDCEYVNVFITNGLIKLVLNTVIKMQKNEFCLNFYTNGRNTNNPYKLKSGQIVCTYRDAGYLQGIIDVSGFSTYKVLVTFDGDSDGFGTENPIPFVINNIVYARSTNRNFNTGSSIAFNYLVIGK